MERKEGKNIIVLFFVYCTFNFIIFLKEVDFLYPVLSWNVFLSILPLVFIKKVNLDRFNYKDIIYILLWLFFFPNSIYMITDFIHIAGLEYTYTIGDSIYNRSLFYTRDAMIWIRLFLIAGGFFFATTLGLESICIFYDKIRSRLDSFKSASILVIIALLTGTGVYIGRFLRFNSWDIVFNPLTIIKDLMISLDMFSLVFVLSFAILLLFLMGIYIIISKRER